MLLKSIHQHIDNFDRIIYTGASGGSAECLIWVTWIAANGYLTMKALAVGTNFEPYNGCCLHEGGDQQEACGFGSVELCCIGDSSSIWWVSNLFGFFQFVYSLLQIQNNSCRHNALKATEK